MNNRWKQKNISSICRIRRGASPRPIHDYLDSEGMPWVKISDATESNSRFINKTKEFIKQEGVSKSRVVNKGTLILSNSATPGIPKIMGIEACVHDGWLIVDEFDDQVLKEYIYYTFLFEREELLNLSNGSVFRNLKTDIVKNYVINIPPLEEQRVITNFLVKLDEKIETNNRINEKLEEMAQALFNHWFVDFDFPNENGEPYKSCGGEMVESELGEIPKGWTIDKLSSIAEIVMGQSPKGSTYNTENKGLPLLNGATDFQNNNINPSKYTSDPKKIGEKGDLVFGVRATIGLVTELDDKYAIGRGAGIARSQGERYKEFLYETLNIAFENFRHTASGSVYINVSKNDLNDFKIIVPEINNLESYHRTTKSILIERENLKKENRKLITLRDTLLPKLMSGEIRVPLEEVLVVQSKE